MRPATVIPEEPKHYNQRNTRDWCRGKVGIEHQKTWIPDDDCPRRIAGLLAREKQVCRVCGKEFDTRDANYTFGRLVRAAREERGWTQRELAEKVGLPQPNVARIESDEESLPNMKTIARFGHALKAAYHLEFLGVPIEVDGYHQPQRYWREKGWLGS